METSELQHPFAVAVVRRKWLVVAVLLLTVVGTVVAFRLHPASYKATAKLAVSPVSGQDPTYAGLPVVRDTGDAVRTVQTAAVVVANADVASATARALGRGWTPRRVVHSVSVAPVGQTNVLAVEATDRSAVEAARIANAYADAVVKVRNEALTAAVTGEIARVTAQIRKGAGATAAGDPLHVRLAGLRTALALGDPSVTSASAAVVPTAPQQRSLKVLLIMSVLAGLMLGVAAAVGAELLSAAAAEAHSAPETEHGGPPPIVAARAKIGTADDARGRWTNAGAGGAAR